MLVLKIPVQDKAPATMGWGQESRQRYSRMYPLQKHLAKLKRVSSRVIVNSLCWYLAIDLGQSHRSSPQRSSPSLLYALPSQEQACLPNDPFTSYAQIESRSFKTYAPRGSPSAAAKCAWSMVGAAWRESASTVGPVQRFKATLQAITVSLASAGRITVR